MQSKKDSRILNLTKTTQNTLEFNKIVDREFKVFKVQEPVVENDTVAELFRLYEKLYLQIPVEGEINSHTYIVNRSSELANIEKTNEDLELLLQEISQLRVQLLDANEQILKLETELNNARS